MPKKGSAFLYARADVQHLVEPLVVSWGYEAEMPSGSRFIDEPEWTGTRDPAVWLCVSIQAYNSRADVERLVEGLEKLLGRG